MLVGWTGPLSRAGPSRLTLLTRVAAGPIDGAAAVPTVIRKPSALAVVSIGAVAVGGTAKVWPGSSTPSLSRIMPSLTWIHACSVAVMSTGPEAFVAAAAGGGTVRPGSTAASSATTLSGALSERLLSQVAASATATIAAMAATISHFGIARAGSIGSNCSACLAWMRVLPPNSSRICSPIAIRSSPTAPA